MAVIRFKPIKKGKETDPQQFTSVGDAEVVPSAEWQSYLGTQVYSNLQFPAGEFKTLDGDVIAFKGIRIDTVLFTVSKNKLIVETEVQGRKGGPVTQYINEGNFQITCSGIIMGGSFDKGNNNFNVKGSIAVPEEEIRKLNAIVAVPQEIQVVSQFLDFFDISTVIIREFNAQQKEGSQSEIIFNMRMSEDTPLELS